MTVRAKRPCAHAGCHEYATHGSYCEKHYLQMQELIEQRRKEFSRKAGKDRPTSNARGYNYRWQKTSKMYLKLHPVCVMCGAPATEVDHIIPHKGDPELMWSESNYQALCHKCHSKKTYAEVAQQMRDRKRVSIPDMNIFHID